jgi:signal recognition particle receptor subunit beta
MTEPLKLQCKLHLPWSARDAEKVVIPMVILANKNELKEDVSKYHGALKTPKHVEAFENQVYGFMSARGDLNDNNSKAEV